MEKITNQIPKNISISAFLGEKESLRVRLLSQAVSLALFILLWRRMSLYYNNQLLLPTPGSTFTAFIGLFGDPEIWENLLLTLERVLKGFACALLIGAPIGLLMGSSKIAMYMFDPLLGCIRQVPLMAWIPLSIIWFGLGNGPTIFMIALAGIFAVVLNTVAGVRNISPDYYHAARSMGAGTWCIFLRVVLPCALPDILGGARLALGSGWMAVICAEFIATSAGFGFSMVEAQTRMETEKLLALMVLGALVGYTMDKCVCAIGNRLTRWK
ncbi:MAG: ABC transporter permease [Synergistaceae bacterium]|jgi:NitT/TauT family transport system permease protein|nr:ABC transporter permease [Synergistaceae bacterium]